MPPPSPPSVAGRTGTGVRVCSVSSVPPFLFIPFLSSVRTVRQGGCDQGWDDIFCGVPGHVRRVRSETTTRGSGRHQGDCRRGWGGEYCDVGVSHVLPAPRYTRMTLSCTSSSRACCENLRWRTRTARSTGRRKLIWHSGRVRQSWIVSGMCPTIYAADDEIRSDVTITGYST